jgi:hypothetical protein
MENLGSTDWMGLWMANFKVDYLYLYLYYNPIDPYWLPKPTDTEHVTYAYISSKHRTSHLTATFIKETMIHNSVI